MGEVDIAKEHPNVMRMKILGAKVVPVSFGLKTLKEAVDSAFEAYMVDPINLHLLHRLRGGPAPLPHDGTRVSSAWWASRPRSSSSR
jgi:tryptophan synthase beta chain